MKNKSGFSILFLACLIGATFFFSGQSMADENGGSDIENAWQEGFAAGLADSENKIIRDSLDFSLPIAEYNNTMFSGSFKFNGAKWEFENNSFTALDNVVVATVENDGEIIKLDQGHVLRIKLLLEGCGPGSWVLTNDYNSEMLFLYKQLHRKHQRRISWGVPTVLFIGGAFTQEWIFLCAKQGKSRLEFSNHAYDYTPSGGYTPRTITFDIEVE